MKDENSGEDDVMKIKPVNDFLIAKMHFLI